MATDSAGHNLVDLVGNTLVVSDIQISATGAAGVGTTGISLQNSTFSTETLTGQQRVMSAVATQTAGSATTAAILIGSDQIGIYWGTGTPSGQLAAITSSLYLNKGGTTVSTRAYVNTGGSSWTAITTVA